MFTTSNHCKESIQVLLPMEVCTLELNAAWWRMPHDFWQTWYSTLHIMVPVVAQVLYVNGQKDTVMDVVSSPNNGLSLLLGQNGQRYLKGQADEVMSPSHPTKKYINYLCSACTTSMAIIIQPSSGTLPAPPLQLTLTLNPHVVQGRGRYTIQKVQCVGVPALLECLLFALHLE